MQVKIIETGSEESLCAVDAASGCDWTRDLIGNHNAFNDGQFSQIDDSNVYLCSQDTFDWWDAVINNLNKADEMVMEAKARDLWSDEVERDYQDIGNMDLDDQAAACRNFVETLLARQEVLEAAQGMGLTNIDADKLDRTIDGPDKGLFVGKIVGVDTEKGLVFQATGRGDGVVLPLDKLSRPVEVGEMATITFKDGRGTVADRGQAQAQDRGR